MECAIFANNYAAHAGLGGKRAHQQRDVMRRAESGVEKRHIVRVQAESFAAMSAEKTHCLRRVRPAVLFNHPLETSQVGVRQAIQEPMAVIAGDGFIILNYYGQRTAGKHPTQQHATNFRSSRRQGAKILDNFALHPVDDIES